MTEPVFHCVAVIPAYNEEGTIRAVVGGTLRHIHHVIVADDASVDRTAERLRELPVTVLRQPHHLGKGAVLWAGMQQAIEYGATAIITLDGDGQHDPDDIPVLLAMHRRDPSAIVIGGRLHNREAIPWPRYLANRTANFWISWAAGARIQDSQSGFRLYPATVLRTVGRHCDAASGFAFESELLIEAGRTGVPIRTVPVSAIYGGHLRKSHFRQGRDVLRITRMVAGKLIQNGLNIPVLRKSRRPAPPVVKPADFPAASHDLRVPRRRRILFIAEAVTLAHVARSAALARTLNPERYEVHLACDGRYLHLFDRLPATMHRIDSIGSEQFQDRLRKGSPLYTADELKTYVRQDLRLLADVNPDAVVGDFRLSLSVSARVAAVPYLTVTNAHWSPYARPHFIVPELAITERFGTQLGQVLFTAMRPFVFAQQASALNQIRKEYGLPSIGHSLSKIFTEADETLYADLPELVPTFDRSPHHHYLGPVLWSPDAIPAWWGAVPQGRPLAYVSLGTSGRPDLLSSVLWGLHQAGIGALVSTAGRRPPDRRPDHTWIAPYLPGISASGRVDLVVCNGGSATVYQAFAAGVPVLGIPNNLDQYLMMDYVQRHGAGEMVRAGDASLPAVAHAAQRLVRDPIYRLRAGRLSARIAAGYPAAQLDHVLAQILGCPVPAASGSVADAGSCEGDHAVHAVPAPNLVMHRKEPSRDAQR